MAGISLSRFGECLRESALAACSLRPADRHFPSTRRYVASVNCWKLVPPGSEGIRQVLRQRVARPRKRVWKLCTGKPSAEAAKKVFYKEALS